MEGEEHERRELVKGKQRGGTDREFCVSVGFLSQTDYAGKNREIIFINND